MLYSFVRFSYPDTITSVSSVVSVFLARMNKMADANQFWFKNSPENWRPLGL